eukprot:SAG31_NODE_38049_length_299_cov_1.000000_1_plen_74_part_10
MLSQPEVAVALVGGKTPKQVEQNIKYVNGFTTDDLEEIEAILEEAPEISWEITNGGADTPKNNLARIAARLAKL